MYIEVEKHRYSVGEEALIVRMKDKRVFRVRSTFYELEEIEEDYRDSYIEDITFLYDDPF